MSPEALALKYERLASENLPGTMVPVQLVYRTVADELRQLEVGGMVTAAYMTTHQVAKRFTLNAKTIAHKCHAGEFEGAYKTSDSKGGEWRIPRKAVEMYERRMREGQDERAA